MKKDKEDKETRTGERRVFKCVCDVVRQRGACLCGGEKENEGGG